MYSKLKRWFPHDLLIVQREALKNTILPEWFPLSKDSFIAVVRRDYSSEGKIPIGLRGRQRDQRLGLFIDEKFILSRITPEELVPKISDFPTRGTQLDFLSQLSRFSFPFKWGVTGSIAYSLVSGAQYWKTTSDIDLRVVLPHEVQKKIFDDWLLTTNNAPVVVDTQVETPHGGFALKEWLTKTSVLLKTNRGPLITHNPWSLN